MIIRGWSLNDIFSEIFIIISQSQRRTIIQIYYPQDNSTNQTGTYKTRLYNGMITSKEFIKPY